MKLETEKKQGQYNVLYINPGDTAVLKISEGKAVYTKAVESAKYNKPEHYKLFLMAETNLEPDEIKPITLEILNGKLGVWDAASKSIKYEDSDIAGLIFSQLHDSEFPKDGFKGILKFMKDKKVLKGQNPLQDVEEVELSELPELPVSNGNGGARGPSFQPRIEQLEDKKTFLCNELKEILKASGNEDVDGKGFYELLSEVGISEPSKQFSVLINLIQG